MVEKVRGGDEKVRGGDEAAASDHEVPTRTTEQVTLDARLRSLATKRAHLDADEARALRDAERLELHEAFGFGSLLSYLEHVFGYAPRVALDRLRVARALDGLPVLADALESSTLCYSAIRELTRVATAETEEEWRDAALGKTAGVVANLVAGLTRGDKPTDRPRLSTIERPYELDLIPEAVARLREVRADMDAEAGCRVTDSEFVMALCEAWMISIPMETTDVQKPGSTDDRDEDEDEILGTNRRVVIDNGRARFQLAISVCPACRRGRQDGGGISVPVLPSTLARAECDAQRVGSLDGDRASRASQDIPPATRRFVFRRDRGRCVVPGCRGSRFLEVHHVVPRADGGSHHASNLVLLCGLCRARHKPHYAAYLVMPRSGGPLVEDSRCLRGIIRARSGRPSGCRRADSDLGQHAGARS